MTTPPFDRMQRLARTIASRIVSRLDACIVYVHFPKCAGTSVHQALASGFPKDRIQHIDPVSSARAAKFLQCPVLAYRRDLLVYHLSRSGSPWLLSGHWGINEDLCHEYQARWDFITLFRDPVERWFSHYFYDRYKSNSEYRRIDEDLEEFLATSRATREGTLYVRMLTAGFDASPMDVDSACRSLEHFTLLGDQKRIVPFVETIGRRIGTRLRLPMSNTSPVNQEKWGHMVEKYQDEVTKLCEYDLAVYHFAQKRMT